MKIAKITINNFRGISQSELFLPDHGVLVGDNNTGKTSVLEALDLVLGPDRLNRRPPVDEHDFFQGNYLNSPNSDVPSEEDGDEEEDALTVEKEENPKIVIEATIVKLSEEQLRHFHDYLEFWDDQADKLYDKPEPEGVDAANILPSLRVRFVGWYDDDEDDFDGKSYFARTFDEGGEPQIFRRKDKQHCGFLYLRSVRTGSRALSLERGSLLDIILRIKEVRPQMWEETIDQLSDLSIATKPELGISEVLESINAALKKYVPKEWGAGPKLKVSTLTRENLRKVITPFIATGEGDHSAPFYRQGTGTINILVLAMLSQIAEDKQNVIFAMEEPETAIPPHSQKRIIHEVRKLSSQAIFTSHSPYVLEEFSIDETVVLSRDNAGNLKRSKIVLPDTVKAKRYRQDFRIRFCEGLLSRRVLVAEGSTETNAFPAVCRRLYELDPKKYAPLEALGICTIDAGGEGAIAGTAELFQGLGKQVFAICDKQTAVAEATIVGKVQQLFMHDETGFEKLVLNNTTEAAMQRFADQLIWPPHILDKHGDPVIKAKDALLDYFKWSKADWGAADYLVQCTEEEIPEWLRQTALDLKELIDPAPAPVPSDEHANAENHNETD